MAGSSSQVSTVGHGRLRPRQLGLGEKWVLPERPFYVDGDWVGVGGNGWSFRA